MTPRFLCLSLLQPPTKDKSRPKKSKGKDKGNGTAAAASKEDGKHRRPRSLSAGSVDHSRRDRSPSPAPPSPFVVPAAPSGNVLSALRTALQPHGTRTAVGTSASSQVSDFLFDTTKMRVTYTSDPEVARVWVQKYFPDPSITSRVRSTSRYVGLDAEWRPVFGKGQTQRRVALMQLGSATGAVLLLHLHRMPAGVPQSVKELLMSKHVMKVGVGVLEDSRKLYRDFGVVSNAVVDVGTLAKNGDVLQTSGKGYSLFNIAYHYLKCSNWKSKRVTVRGV